MVLVLHIRRIEENRSDLIDFIASNDDAPAAANTSGRAGTHGSEVDVGCVTYAHYSGSFGLKYSLLNRVKQHI